MDTPDTTNWHQIRIALPLPLSISGAVIQAIGTMWPQARISTTDPRHLTMLVPPVEPKEVKQELQRIAEGARSDEDLGVESDAHLTDFTNNGITISAPEQASLVLAEYALSILDSNEAAVNYIEQTLSLDKEVTGPDGESQKKLCIIACWAPNRTPHELRRQAEDRADQLEAENKELRAALNLRDETSIPKSPGMWHWSLISNNDYSKVLARVSDLEEQLDNASNRTN